MLILIPAYRPDERLVRLADTLRQMDPTVEIVVVDDGSGPRFHHVFEALGSKVHVLRHDDNRGKGAALRTGFAWARDERPGAGIVTADADGQHLPRDILAVAARLAEAVGVERGRPREGSRSDEHETIVLGCRRFTGDVPLRSRLGNSAARAVFAAASRRSVSDTQTGLRGLPSSAIPFLLGLPGDRFDYELRMLLEAGRHGFRLAEVPIETVYLEDNRSSHFRPVVDSLRVARPFIRFALSSMLAFVIDALALWVLVAATGSLLIGVVGARVLSASINFLVNRSVVFAQASGPGGSYAAGRDRRAHPPRRLRADALRYGALALVVLATNYAYLETLTSHGVPLVIAKVVTETVLFIISFQVQRRLVFPTSTHGSSHAAGEVSPHAAEKVSPHVSSQVSVQVEPAERPIAHPADETGRPVGQTYSGRRASVSAPLSK